MITEELNISISETPESRISQLDPENIPFGKMFTDHMFVVDFRNNEWQDARIVPYGRFSMDPASSCLHYGQAIFEGMKAYKTLDDDVLFFRPNDNIDRFNKSAERLCMPTIPTEIFREGLFRLVNLDRNWVPKSDGASLYIRPVMIGVDEYIGVKPSQNYRFYIICCPVGAYYSNPVRVKVEKNYTRAAKGGVGYVKAAGNYASALYPAKMAQEEGYDQLVWTDASEHKYIEESGTMNVMFVIDGKLITPELNSTILPGVTRDSVLNLARDWGIEVQERKVSILEVFEAAKNGTLTEAFGTGTAATIAQIAMFSNDGEDVELPPVETRKISTQIHKHLESLKRGNIDDKFNWTERI